MMCMRVKLAVWVWVSVLLLGISGLLVAQEMSTSAYQAHFFAELARKATYTVGAGPSPSIRFPQSAPYDDRLGYAQLPVLLGKLKTRDFEIVKQARISEGMAAIVDKGYFAPYPEKTQAGLRILDSHHTPLFQARYPKRVFERFDDIAPILVETLLFIENRELLDTEHPKRNPAVEWDRLAKAVADRAAHALDSDRDSPGGSTLATQIEKYRHSPEGRTSSVREKLRQMGSASVRSYLDGEQTMATRQRIVRDYLNSVPLAAAPGYGEINGLGDGLWAWYGVHFANINRLLQS